MDRVNFTLLLAIEAALHDGKCDIWSEQFRNFGIPSIWIDTIGLTDFFAQLMGNLPIVQSVGGLVKTIDNRFGYAYLGSGEELLEALRRALRDYREPNRVRIRSMQRDAVINIRENFTWSKVFEKKYLPMYQLAIDKMKPAMPYEGRGPKRGKQSDQSPA